MRTTRRSSRLSLVDMSLLLSLRLTLQDSIQWFTSSYQSTNSERGPFFFLRKPE